MIAIHPATISDATSIAEVHVGSWRAGYRDLMPPSVLAKLSVSERAATRANDIASNNASVFVAEVDDAIASLLSIKPRR